MSGLDVALRNLLAWSLQVGVLGLAAAALGRVVPIERPAARLALGQALLALILLLPVLQPWPAAVPSATVSFGFSPVAPPPGAAAVSSSPGGAPFWSAVVAGALALGWALRLAQLAVGLGRLRSLRRRARPLEPFPWLRALRDEVSPGAVFLVSPATHTPATFGVRRPVVLLPPSFASMSRERQQAVALHELVHARRGDWLSLVLEELLLALLFFHPAVRWLVARVRLAREQTVDVAVVRHLGTRESYLESLLAAARSASSARAVPAALFLRESHLRERVDLLLRGVSMSRLRTAAHVAVTAVVVLLAVAWAATALPLQSAATPATAPAKVAPQDKASAQPAPDKAPAKPEPKLVHKVDPVYPADARSEGVQGIFIVGVIIGKDGTIRDAKVVLSAPTSERLAEIKKTHGTPATPEGDGRLAKAALDAVKQWRYEPALVGGKPADLEAMVTINFRLQ